MNSRDRSIREEIRRGRAVPGLRPTTARRARWHSGRAFTLIEVMIASGILFMCLFAILALLANSLRNARALQRRSLDAGMAAAQLYVQLTTTNQVYEGRGSGDFGDLYPDSQYDYELQEIATNGLCRLDVVVRERGQPTDSKMTLLLFLPNLRKSR